MMLNVEIEQRLGSFELQVAFSSIEAVTALFGRSGSGKTSIISAIAGISRPDRGRIVLNDEVLFDSESGIDVPIERRRIGYVFQEGRLFPHLTVRQNLLYGYRRHEAGPRLAEPATIIGLLGLDHLMERRPAALSGGEKQRVAIGRALLANPRLLLMDEPLASLDGHRKTEILDYVELMRDSIDLPIIYVSHAVDEVLRLADQVVLVAEGRVAATGTASEVMGRPELRQLAGSFDGGTVIEGRVLEQNLDDDISVIGFDGGRLLVPDVAALVGESVRMRVRARDVSLALSPPAGISILNVLPGRIVAIDSPRAGAVDVLLEIGAVHLRSRITRRSALQLGLAPGTAVYAMVKGVSLDRR
jgi:molybdate transport system ATP-binding protein